MSRSGPFFNTSAPGRYKPRPVDNMSDKDFYALHWTEQLRLRPLRDRKRYVNEQGDFDTRLDNWDDPEEVEITT